MGTMEYALDHSDAGNRRRSPAYRTRSFSTPIQLLLERRVTNGLGYDSRTFVEDNSRSPMYLPGLKNTAGGLRLHLLGLESRTNHPELQETFFEDKSLLFGNAQKIFDGRIR